MRCVQVFYKIMRLPHPFIKPLKNKGSQFFASQSRLNHNKAVLIIAYPFPNMQSRIKYRWVYFCVCVCVCIFLQTPASSRTASFSENKAKVESSPAKKAKTGAPIGEIKHSLKWEIFALWLLRVQMCFHAWVHCWTADRQMDRSLVIMHVWV